MNTKLSKIVAMTFIFAIVPFFGTAFSSGDHGGGHGDDHMKEKSSGHAKKKSSGGHGGHWGYEGEGGPAN